MSATTGSVEPQTPGTLELDTSEFLTGYAMHDAGEQYIKQRLRWWGFQVEDFGIDKRHEADPDVNYGRPDLKVISSKDTESYLDVKTKSNGNEEWMGRLDSWKFEGYLESDRDDTEFYGGENSRVWMAFLLMDSETNTIRDEQCYPVRSTNQVKAEFQSGGQTVCELHPDEQRSWNEMIGAMQ